MPKQTELTFNLMTLIEEPTVYLSVKFTILNLNVATEKLFNVKKASMIGKSFTAICPDFEPGLDKLAFNQRLISTIGKKTLSWHVLTLKKPKGGIQFIVIGSYNSSKSSKKLNNSLQVNVSQSSSLRPNTNNSARLEHIEGMYRYMESIISKIPVSVYWMNTDCVYLGCSNDMAKLLNLQSRDDIVGKTYADLYDKQSASHYKKADEAVMCNGIPLTLEEPLYYPDGTKKIYLSKKIPLHDENGNIIGMLGVSVDITDRKQMEDDLKRAKEEAETANRAKTQFLANMSHDIRTPLSGVIGLSEILENSLLNPEQKQDAHLLHDSGEELLNLLNDILDDVRADSMSENHIQNECFDLYECIQDLVRLESPTTKMKQLGLQVDIEASTPQYILSDRKKIFRILLNLLGNAIKFTQSGHITIEVRILHSDSSRVHLQFGVADTGIGIPKELQPQVFNRFFRVTSSYKGLYPGHGLGLHIAQSYVHLLGGHITLSSEEGKGSTFNFDLECEIGQPNNSVLAETPSPALSLAKTAAEPPKTDTYHFLLIEDNAVALKVLETRLLHAGYRFTSAINGEQGLELAKTMHFDLIITDIGLPGISGDELAQFLREWETSLKRKPVPIIGLTGHVEESSKAHFIASGMNDVLTKPINLMKLQQIVNQLATPCAFISPVAKNKKENVSNPLGIDLSYADNELFQLQSYPLFDEQLALKQIGDLSLLIELINEFIITSQDDVTKLQEAYKQSDWHQVEKIAHKMKGGAIYIGTQRLRYACQYLERYLKAGNDKFLKELYHQLLDSAVETEPTLQRWLNSHQIK